MVDIKKIDRLHSLQRIKESNFEARTILTYEVNGSQYQVNFDILTDDFKLLVDRYFSTYDKEHDGDFKLFLRNDKIKRALD